MFWLENLLYIYMGWNPLLIQNKYLIMLPICFHNALVFCSLSKKKIGAYRWYFLAFLAINMRSFKLICYKKINHKKKHNLVKLMSDCSLDSGISCFQSLIAKFRDYMMHRSIQWCFVLFIFLYLRASIDKYRNLPVCFFFGLISTLDYTST